MTRPRQYTLARLASNAWPRCGYRLLRHYGSLHADAPALFQVVRRSDNAALGTLTVTADGASYGGFAAGELADAVAAVRRAVEARGR